MARIRHRVNVVRTVLSGMNRLAEARTHSQKSLVADANQFLAHEVLGRLLESAGHTPDVVSHYSSVAVPQAA